VATVAALPVATRSSIAVRSTVGARAKPATKTTRGQLAHAKAVGEMRVTAAVVAGATFAGAGAAHLAKNAATTTTQSSRRMMDP
jgi:hypothetical protein